MSRLNELLETRKTAGLQQATSADCEIQALLHFSAEEIGDLIYICEAIVAHPTSQDWIALKAEVAKVHMAFKKYDEDDE